MYIPLHHSLIKAITIYVIVFTISTLLFALCYTIYSNIYQLQFTIEREKGTFFNWLYFSIMIFFGSVDYDTIPISIRYLVIIQHFCNSVLMPITSGIIFYYILNRPPKMLFPDRLIIRRRTSEESESLITLGVMIANKDKEKIFNVNCQLIYVYYKVKPDGSVGVNNYTNFTESIPYIDNFHRFAFAIESFPAKFIETIIERNTQNMNDRIILIITGKFGKFGDDFMIEKYYTISDIEIAKDTKPVYNYVDIDALSKSKFTWSNINKLIYYSESERQDLVLQIRSILEKKRNK